MASHVSFRCDNGGPCPSLEVVTPEGLPVHTLQNTKTGLWSGGQGGRGPTPASKNSFLQDPWSPCLSDRVCPTFWASPVPHICGLCCCFPRNLQPPVSSPKGENPALWQCDIFHLTLLSLFSLLPGLGEGSGCEQVIKALEGRQGRAVAGRLWALQCHDPRVRGSPSRL